jgi:hypothetical protein
LAVSGGYHNGLLTLAVFCGIPAALMFAVALLLTAKKFIRMLPGLDNVWLKYLSVSVMAAFVPYTFHMLINGSGPQIFKLCVMMGGMNGILWLVRHDPDPLTENKSRTQPVGERESRPAKTADYY